MTLLFISALLSGTIGAVLFYAFGGRTGFVDYPVERSSHRVPVPKGGGAGILLCFIIASVVLGTDPRLWVPVVLVSLTALVGDRIHISALFRLTVHFTGALFIVTQFGGFQNSGANPYFAGFFWILFIAGTANVYNFMDGIDGISAVTGIAAFSSLSFLLFTHGDLQLSLLTLCIALACAGFLPFNMPNARVFMGDAGSILLGFLFGSLALSVSDSFLESVVLVGFLFPFYADALTTIFVRLKDGENIFNSHRRHLYQIFANELDVAHWKISVCYCLVQVFIGLSILAVSSFGSIPAIFLFAVYFIVFSAVSVIIRKKTGDIDMMKSGLLTSGYLSKNFIIVLTGDILLFAVAILGACFFRFGFDVPAFTVEDIRDVFPVIVLIKITAFAYFDLYKGMWRYAGFSDFLNVVKASVLSTLCAAAVTYFVRDFNSMPRSLFLFDFFLTVVLITSFRFLIRFYFEKINNSFLVSDFSFSNLKKTVFHNRAREKNFKKLLIIGAGDCGENIFKEIQSNPGVKLDVVGFVDDNPEKIGKKIHQVPVLNSLDYLDSVIEKTGAEELLIAIPSASSSQMRRIVGLCENTGLKFQTIPNMAELINGNVSAGAIREISFRDLLGRKPIELNREVVRALLKDKSVLVTGAGGSIGSELCRQICRFKPGILLMLDNTETLLFEIDYEMKRHFKEINTVPVLADTRNKRQLEKIFLRYSPDIVFHAAAYKHVSMLEMHPWCAVENNILGTVNMVNVAKAFNVDRLVFVSTDKAVRPTSVMGASKRIAEIFVQNQHPPASAGTKFMTVRFGNVAGSSGSVVSIFKKQIREGGPVTVTHPDVTRFFMTIPEACQLILQAGAMGKGSEIFLLDMGTSVKIADMAKDMIRLYGFKPDMDMKIEYIGLRKGEKLFEELAANDEDVIRTSHKSILMLNSRKVCIDNFNKSIAVLKRYAEAQDTEAIISEFQNIVQDYTPSGIHGSAYPPN